MLSTEYFITTQGDHNPCPIELKDTKTTSPAILIQGSQTLCEKNGSTQETSFTTIVSKPPYEAAWELLDLVHKTTLNTEENDTSNVIIFKINEIIRQLESLISSNNKVVLKLSELSANENEKVLALIQSVADEKQLLFYFMELTYHYLKKLANDSRFSNETLSDYRQEDARHWKETALAHLTVQYCKRSLDEIKTATRPQDHNDTIKRINNSFDLNTTVATISLKKEKEREKIQAELKHEFHQLTLEEELEHSILKSAKGSLRNGSAMIDELLDLQKQKKYAELVSQLSALTHKKQHHKITLESWKHMKRRFSWDPRLFGLTHGSRMRKNLKHSLALAKKIKLKNTTPKNSTTNAYKDAWQLLDIIFSEVNSLKQNDSINSTCYKIEAIIDYLSKVSKKEHHDKIKRWDNLSTTEKDTVARITYDSTDLELVLHYFADLSRLYLDFLAYDGRFMNDTTPARSNCIWKIDHYVQRTLSTCQNTIDSTSSIIDSTTSHTHDVIKNIFHSYRGTEESLTAHINYSAAQFKNQPIDSDYIDRFFTVIYPSTSLKELTSTLYQPQPITGLQR